MTDAECAAVFQEMLDRLTFEGESLPAKAAIERAIQLLRCGIELNGQGDWCQR